MRKRLVIAVALVVLGAIVMGTRAGGVGVGLWGGLGTFVLVFLFGEAPGEPPAAAMAIILAVVLGLFNLMNVPVGTAIALYTFWIAWKLYGASGRNATEVR